MTTAPNRSVNTAVINSGEGEKRPPSPAGNKTRTPSTSALRGGNRGQEPDSTPFSEQRPASSRPLFIDLRRTGSIHM